MSMKENRVLGISPLIIILFIAFIITFIFANAYTVIPYLLIVIFILKNRNDNISPVIYIALPWSFMFVMQYSSFITYSQKTDQAAPILYLIMGLTMIFFGFWFGKRVKIYRTESVSNTALISPNINGENVIKIIDFLSIIGIIGSVLFIIEMLFITGIDISQLYIMREQYVNKEATAFSQIGNILSWGSLIALPALVLLWNRATTSQRTLWIITAGLYSSYSILSAGRQVVFQIALIMIAVVTIKGYVYPREKATERQYKRDKKKMRRKVGILIVLAIGYCLYVAVVRNSGGISTSKLEVLEYYFGCSFDDSIMEILKFLPGFLVDAIAEAIVYFTHQIAGFTVFWDIDDIGPFWGLYSMPFIDRRFDSLGLTTYSVEEKMDYVRQYMSSQQAMPVGWKTFFTFLIFDYGRIGGIIFCFLIGLVMAKVYQNFKKNKSFFSALLLIQIDLYCFYTIMFPSIAETGLLLMLIFSLFGVFLEKENKKIK